MAKMMGRTKSNAYCYCCNDSQIERGRQRHIEECDWRSFEGVADSPDLEAGPEPAPGDWPHITCNRCGRNGLMGQEVDLLEVDYEYYCIRGMLSCYDLTEMEAEAFPVSLDFLDPMVHAL